MREITDKNTADRAMSSPPHSLKFRGRNRMNEMPVQARNISKYFGGDPLGQGVSRARRLLPQLLR
jgi:hypothetical protein